MRILLAASNTGCNGAVVYARRLAPLLRDRGHQVWLAAAEDSWIARELAGRVPLYATRFLRWPLDDLRRCADFCRDNEIQLFHSHLTRANNFGALLQRLHGVPSLAHLHANHLQLHAWFHRKVIAVSSDTLRRWRHRLVGLGRRGAVLPNFVEPEVFRPADGEDRLRALLRVPAETPVLLAIGTVGRRKGQDIAVRALPDIRRRHPRAILALIGAGELPRGLEGTPGLVRLGHRDDVPALLPWATLCLVPSRDEPFGLAAIEAMSCGVPVLTSGAGGLAEIVADGAGGLFRPGDPRDLAEQACRWLDDDAARLVLAAEGRARVARDYLPASHLEALERIYAEVVSGE